MHVVRDWAEVVKELREHGPATVLVPDRFTDEDRTQFFHGLPESETTLRCPDITQTLVGRPVFIRGYRRRGEPSFVDAATMETESVQVAGMQLQSSARLEQ